MLEIAFHPSFPLDRARDEASAINQRYEPHHEREGDQT